jgi:hypothetical protein
MQNYRTDKNRRLTPLTQGGEMKIKLKGKEVLGKEESVNIYIGDKDKEILVKIKEEAKKRKRSICFLVKEKLRLAYGIKNGGD